MPRPIRGRLSLPRIGWVSGLGFYLAAPRLSLDPIRGGMMPHPIHGGLSPLPIRVLVG